MMARVKEDKLFFGGAAALLVLLFVWNSMLRGPLAESKRKMEGELAQLKKRHDELSRQGAASADQLGSAQKAATDLKERLEKVVERVKFTPDGRFVPQGKGPLEFFLEKRVGTKQLTDQAKQRGILFGKIQQLGFVEAPATDEEAKDHLVRMDVTYAVIEAMIGLPLDLGMGVQKIEEIKPLVGAGAPTKESFLTKVKVEFKFTATERGAFGLAHMLAAPEKKNRCALSVEKFVVQRKDMMADYVDVEMHVAAVIVNSGRPAVEATQP